MFFSRNKGPKVRDVMYLSEEACAKAVNTWLQDHPNGRAGVWFQQDLEHLRAKLGSAESTRAVLAARLSFGNVQDGEILFVGHYPLRSVETSLFEELGIKDVLVYGHFDMPFMVYLGSGRIKELMIKMGMQSDEPIEHNMISGAIGHALDKISEKVVADMPARSEAEWMQFLGN